MGGTQDNGTHALNGSGSGFVTIFGDGGQSGINLFNPNVRFHTFFNATPEVNFHGTDPLGWDVIHQPLNGVEPQSFYIPLAVDPAVNGTVFAGLDYVWRSQDNGGSQASLDTHCNEFTGDFTITCGDWVRTGTVAAGHALGDGTFRGADKATAGYVVATERAPSDNGTLGRHAARSCLRHEQRGCGVAVVCRVLPRIDSSAQPSRFVSGISVDPNNPNHAFISYSGYNAYATAAGTATGHVFEVTYDPTTHTAAWSGDLAGGDPSIGGLCDQPITGIAADWQTGDLYVSTDFGVDVRKAGNTTWQPTAGRGLRVLAASCRIARLPQEPIDSTCRFRSGCGRGWPRLPRTKPGASTRRSRDGSRRRASSRHPTQGLGSRGLSVGT
jgi:hypothetical protein